MFFADTHTHTTYSFDGQCTVGQMVEGARRRGVDVLAITEHSDFSPEGRCPHYQASEAACQREMESWRSRNGAPQVLYGIELGQPQVNPAAAHALLAAHGYDMVIGSVHTLSDGRDVYHTPYTGLDVCYSMFDRYFDDLKNLLAFGDFDTLGHLDYPMRVMGGVWPAPTLAEFRDRIDPLLRELAQQGKALEVNAKGCREWFRQPGPEKWILRQFKAYGGEMITTGSDAHSAENCGKGLAEAETLCRAAGFDRIVTFRGRKPRYHAI